MANIIKQLIDSDGNNIYPIAYAQGGVKMDLLWTNPSPTSSFSAQTVSLDLSKYDYVYTTFKWGSDSGRAMLNSLVKVGSDNGGLVSAIYNARVYREFLVTFTGVQFIAGYYGVNNSSSMSQDNSKAVPYQIFGIKFSWVVPTSVQGLQYVEV